MAPSLKLYYFGMPGRAAVPRMILDYAGIPFEDVTVERENWPKLKPEMPWGQMPVLEVDGKKIAQSNAISRYVAKLANIGGNNPLEDCQIDSVVNTLEEVGKKIFDVRMEKDETKKKTMEETLNNETLPYYLQRLDNIAKENNGHFALKRLTWADIFFVGSYESVVNGLKKDIFVDYPNLIKVKQNVLALPTIKEHIKNRKNAGAGPPGWQPIYNLKNDI